jgi:anti-sigma regulatory factor (Ser/Thr protein kinase)
VEVISHHQQITVTEASQPGAARAAIHELAEVGGFSDLDVHRAGLVATELATNLVKYGQSGELLLRLSRRAPTPELEVISLDRGPGIRDIVRALDDGHSTGGSPGTGLGAVRRMSDDFEIYSQAGKGTAVLARLRGDRRRRQLPGPIVFGVVSVPKAGELACGDGWRVQSDADRASVLVADGLGHGEKASDAARAAIARFELQPRAELPALLQSIHEALRSTRGAAVAIACVRRGAAVVKYGGVGNISAAVVQNGSVRQGVSHNGTMGHEARRFHEYSYPWSTDALIVMHTDGLASHWSLDEYPGVRQRDLTLIAALLYRDHSRQRDDVTVLAARESA